MIVTTLVCICSISEFRSLHSCKYIYIEPSFLDMFSKSEQRARKEETKKEKKEEFSHAICVDWFSWTVAFLSTTIFISLGE